ncbi:hypothetical protein V8245_05230 [Flavobacterium columnare]|uniref:hypothetical protein n=1 Tax=Flavobacterium columnare TaxID=996 RepID=UPI003C2F7A15
MKNFIELKKQLTSLEDDLINLELINVNANLEEGLPSLEQELSGLVFNNISYSGNKEELKIQIKKLIFIKSVEVFNSSKEESAYWDYCSFSVYNDKYQEMLNAFLKDDNKNHNNEELFIELELSKYNRLLENFEKKNYSTEIKPALEKKIAFLSDKFNSQSLIPHVDYSDINTNEVEDSYPFKNIKSLELFNQYFEKYKNDKHIYAHLSFVYRTMVNEGYIREECKPENFKLILNKSPYELYIEHKSFKKLYQLKNKSRENYYYELKDSIFKTNVLTK